MTGLWGSAVAMPPCPAETTSLTLRARAYGGSHIIPGSPLTFSTGSCHPHSIGEESEAQGGRANRPGPRQGPQRRAEEELPTPTQGAGGSGKVES